MNEFKQALSDVDLALYEYREKRHAQTRQKRIARLKAVGLCVVCGKVPTQAGYTRCKACRDRSYASRKARWRAGQKTVREIENQKRCNAKSTAKMRELRNERAAKGLCITCGAALPPGYSFLKCESCRAKSSAANRRSRERKKHADARGKKEAAGRVD